MMVFLLLRNCQGISFIEKVNVVSVMHKEAYLNQYSRIQ